MTRLFAILFAIAGVSLYPAAAHGKEPAKPGLTYRVVSRWRLGGTGGWDLLTVDASARRVYVSRSDRVLVLDADSGKQVGEIADTPGVHGIALAPGLNRGYTSNGRANSVTVFDLKTLTTLTEVKVNGGNPDTILFDPSTQRVFTFNGHSSNASVIDARGDREIGTIALDGKPEFAVADGRGRIYVNIEDRHELTVIDANAGKALATWPLNGCEEPTGLAFDAVRGRLFSVCGNAKMIVTDSSNGKQIASLAIGNGVDGAAFDAQRGLVFSSNGDGTLTVIREEDADHYRVVESLATQKSARTLALDAKTHRLFLPAAVFGPRPPATSQQPHPRPAVIAGSFTILVVASD